MKKLSLALCVLLTGAVAQAAEQGAPQAAVGDAAAGKEKSATCAACHGADGNSMAPTFPKIAGQHASYIFEQLNAFKDGGRQDPSMSPQVANLNEQDMRDLAAYFSGQTVKLGAADKDAVALGQKIYRGGDKAKGVMACTACHGPTGAGNPSARYPSLSGQHPDYILKQLQGFKAGARMSDPGSKFMTSLAARMSEEEMKAVSQYVAGLN